jgi:tetratricopeptide (TPR) repeat protein
MSAMRVRTKIALQVFVAFFVLIGKVGHGFAGEVDTTKLRELVRLPSVSVTFEFPMPMPASFRETRPTKSENQAELAKIKKSLTGKMDDADRQFRLGELYEKLDDTEQSQQAYRLAVKLYRQQLAAKPRHGLLLAKLGSALQEVGELAEAEKRLREAIVVAPQDWHCWFELGRFVEDRTFRGVVSTDDDNCSATQFIKEFEALQSQPAKIDIFLRKLNEAREYFDKAITLAPDEASLYAERAQCHFFIALGRKARAGISTDAMHQFEWGPALFAPEVVADYRQVAQLKPNSPEIIGAVITADYYSGVFHRPKGEEFYCPLSKLPTTSQRSIQKGMARLNHLAEKPDRRIATAAAMQLGMLEWLVMQDTTAAQAWMKRAVQTNPDNDTAWEFFTASTMLDGVCTNELLKVCQARVKQHPTARNHVLVAKAYALKKQYDKAEEYVRAAVKLQPEGFLANLSLAALLLKYHTDDASLKEAKKLIEKAAEGCLNTKIGKSDEALPDDAAIQMAELDAIQSALAGKMDAARGNLQMIRELDPNNDEVAEIAKAAGLEDHPEVKDK